MKGGARTNLHLGGLDQRKAFFDLYDPNLLRAIYSDTKGISPPDDLYAPQTNAKVLYCLFRRSANSRPDRVPFLNKISSHAYIVNQRRERECTKASNTSRHSSWHRTSLAILQVSSGIRDGPSVVRVHPTSLLRAAGKSSYPSC